MLLLAEVKIIPGDRSGLFFAEATRISLSVSILAEVKTISGSFSVLFWHKLKESLGTFLGCFWHRLKKISKTLSVLILTEVK